MEHDSEIAKTGLTRRAAIATGLYGATTVLFSSVASAAGKTTTTKPTKTQKTKASPKFKLPTSVLQIIVGLAPERSSSQATLALYEREYSKSGGEWSKVGQDIQVRIGKMGLVGGRGLNPNVSDWGDKREGDWKSPAGVFHLSTVYSYEASWESKTKMPFVLVGTRDLMIDDPASNLYNTHVRLDHEPQTEFEKKNQMVQGDSAHALQIFVDHNVSPKPVPGKGSSILLHVWRNEGASPTSGCTAMARENVDQIVAWLDPIKRPVYALLPKPQYSDLAQSWGLPRLG